MQRSTCDKAFTVAVLILTVSTQVYAQERIAQVDAAQVGIAAAQRLFDDARTLMGESRFAEACPKLAESERLEPLSGTLINLAICHEQQGKLASAWLEYHGAEALSLREHHAERRQIALERIARVEPKLSRLKFVLPAPIPDGFWLNIDEQALGPESLKEDLPVDPGTHHIHYGAKGRRTAALTVEHFAPATTTTVTIPSLEDLPKPRVTAPPVLPPDETRTQDAASARHWVLAGAAFGVAVVALGAGTYFGFHAGHAWREREQHCADGCDDRAVEAGRSARELARAADVALGVGALGVGLGSYLLLSMPKRQPDAARVSATVDARHLGLTLRGFW